MHDGRVCTWPHRVLLQSVSSVMSIKKCQGVKQVPFALGPFPRCGFPQCNSPFLILLLSVMTDMILVCEMAIQLI